MTETDFTCPNGCETAPWGVELPSIYDGVCYWWCETCDTKWHRFPASQAARRARVERAWRGE